MEKRTIQALLSGQENFHGVFGALPSSLHETGHYVVHGGRQAAHWMCLEKLAGEDHVNFFDSYAYPPESFHFMAPVCARYYVTFSRRRLQDDLSSTCGHYVIYYVMMRNKGHAFEDILGAFHKSDPLANDYAVQRFLKEQHGVRNPVYHVPYIEEYIAKLSAILERYVKNSG